MSFDNGKLTKFDLYDAVTTLRNNTGWNDAYSKMQRASIDDGRKTVRLHQSNVDRKNRMAKRKQKEGKNARTIQYAKSPKRFFRKKHSGRQRCSRSRN